LSQLPPQRRDETSVAITGCLNQTETRPETAGLGLNAAANPVLGKLSEPDANATVSTSSRSSALVRSSALDDPYAFVHVHDRPATPEDLARLGVEETGTRVTVPLADSRSRLKPAASS
jgi:hypothetical protein